MQIQVENISLSIQGKPILQDVSLDVASGQSLALIGPNGSGKSTLLRVMAGHIRAEHGQVTIGKDRLGDLSPRNLAQRLGFVSQEAGTTDAIAVEDAVKLGRTPWLSLLSPFGREDRRIVETAMSEMAISAYRKKHFNTLSGGERQRVHIARVLAQTPQIFLLDEPTNHLDIRHQIAIIDWVIRQKSTVAMAVHDLNHAFACDRVAVLHGGKLVAFGEPNEVLVPDVIETVFQVAVHPNFAEQLNRPVLAFSKSRVAQ
ncbi:ABC transporter ATP-binding protein [Labrenzia sp. CE80]|uniref:ABC transporter ATP-binding protein n=1 Tax=Labrenzia sp. CE80 TaxID=1788986 RepID=UPI001930EAEC|nr:ABC transporter ATP-binding protein [Labrenzia sp. CE80]